MAWPSTVTTFTNPLASQTLNSPSHSSIETVQNTGIRELMTFLGTMEASTLGTLLGTVYNPQSDGGGHVQSAAKGGTGQTTYGLGNLLVGANTSTISKLAVGTDNQVLTADGAAALGVKWTSPVRIGENASIVTVIGSGETSILNVTIPASVLGSTNAVRGRLFINAYTAADADNLLFKAQYGLNQVTSVLIQPSSAFTGSVGGIIEYNLLANAATNVQRGQLAINLSAERINPLQSSVLGIDVYKMGTASINSAANQTLGITAQFINGTVGSRLDVSGYTVEKIT